MTIKATVLDAQKNKDAAMFWSVSAARAWARKFGVAATVRIENGNGAVIYNGAA